jgi:SAM-dependent methyltransferase
MEVGGSNSATGQTAFEAWPGAERRRPAIDAPNYFVRAPLARWLEREAVRASRDFTKPRILDVGCGRKPYYPFFASFAGEYVGLDLENPLADVAAFAEEMPLPDDSFDLVLCLQVLEHAVYPAAIVRELARVVSPGGRVLASTHGVSVYHPDPIDHWRWTHTGLELLFAENGSWRSLTVEAASGPAGTLAMLVSFYLGVIARRTHVGFAAAALTGLINRLARRLEQNPEVGACRPGALATNYHLVAEAPSQDLKTRVADQPPVAISIPLTTSRVAAASR